MDKPVNCGCGGEAFYVGTKDIGYVYCDKYETETKNYETRAEAIEAWNRAMGAKDVNVPNKDTVIIEPFTTDMNHVGYCKCGYLVNTEWKYCPNCGARLEWI